MSRLRAILPALLLSVWPLAAAADTAITGIVKNVNGNPLQAMVAQAYGADGTLQASGTTDVTGRYEFNVLAGSYRVLAFDPNGGFATEFSGDAPSFDESKPTTVATGQTAVVNFTLHLAGKVVGNVNTSGGTPWPMTVAAYNLSGTRRGFTTTDDNGAYSMVLPPGTYKIAAYDERHAFAPSFYADRQTFADGDPVTVKETQTTSGINFTLQLGANVTGIVTNAQLIPLANAVVLAYNAAGVQLAFTLTDRDGTFAMTLPPGTYRLVAVDPSFVYAAGYLNGANSFETSPQLALAGGDARNNLTFALQQGGQVAGTIADAVTGTGIRNISVAAYNNDGTQRTFVTTDANGRYVLLLPPGNFRIAAFDNALVYATQFYPQSNSFAHATAVAPAPGQTITLPPIALSHGGWFSGFVTDKLNGAFIPGIVVAAYDSDGDQVSNGIASAAGRYRMIVPAGAYKLIAYDPQVLYAPAFGGGAISFNASSPFSIAGETESTVSFALARGTRVNGTVVDRSHAPVSDVSVIAYDLEQNQVATTISRTDGSFRFALVPGKYKFLVFDSNGRYGTTFMGGPTFAEAFTVTVEATGAPHLTVIVVPPPKRRAVRG